MARNLGASLLSMALVAGCSGSGAPGSSPTAQAHAGSPSPVASATTGPAATAVPPSATPDPATVGRLGSTWRFVRDTPRAAAVTAGPSGWVAVGTAMTADQRRTVPAAWTSRDGSEWTPAHVESPAGEPYGEIQLVTARTGALFAAGNGANLTNGLVWHSVEGSAWRVVGSGPTFDLGPCYEGCARFTSIAASSLGIVVAGYRVLPAPGYGSETDIWASVDGSAWRRSPLPGDATGVRVAGEVSVVATPDGFLAAGSLCEAGLDCRAVTWRSRDGLTWSSPSPLPSSAGTTGLRVVSTPTTDVVIGRRCTDGCIYTAWASRRGSDWAVSDLVDRTVTALWPGLLTATGSSFLLVGEKAGRVEVWTSTTGVAWSRETLAAGSFIPIDGLLLLDLAGRTDGAIVVGLGPGSLGDRESPGVWVSP